MTGQRLPIRQSNRGYKKVELSDLVNDKIDLREENVFFEVDGIVRGLVFNPDFLDLGYKEYDHKKKIMRTFPMPYQISPRNPEYAAFLESLKNKDDLIRIYGFVTDINFIPDGMFIASMLKASSETNIPISVQGFYMIIGCERDFSGGFPAIEVHNVKFKREKSGEYKEPN